MFQSMVVEIIGTRVGNLLQNVCSRSCLAGARWL
jgi:hypothetical protein